MVQASLSDASMCIPIDVSIISSQLSRSKAKSAPSESIVARVLSDLSCPLRFPSTCIRNLERLTNNLVPYPKSTLIHPTICPFVKSQVSNPGSWRISVDYVRAGFGPNRYLWDIDHRVGRSLVSCWLIRGRVDEF